VVHRQAPSTPLVARHAGLLQHGVSILSARELSKAYGPQTLFRAVSLSLLPGERAGLLGANGAGKSSLLRVLAGVEPPDGGVIERKRGASALFLPQEPRLPGEQTPRALVEAGLADWHAARARHAEVTAALAHAGAAQDALLAEQAQLAERIEHSGGWERGHLVVDVLQRLGIADVDRAVGSMSGGEQRRVALARILVAEPDLAILDEPTNHLDVETIEYLEEYLTERFAGAVLLVTHDRYVLDAVAERIFELEHGELREFAGSYSDYLEHKEQLLAHAQRAESNRQNRLRRERAWLLRGAKARTTKQKARIKRAEALMAVEAPRLAARAELAGLSAGAAQIGKTVLELHDVAVAIAGRTLISGLTLHMVQGERMGIVGPNGAGKTSLLRLCSGELAPTRGRVKLGARTQVAHFDQARAALRDDWSVYDNVAQREGAERDGGGHVYFGALELDLRSYLERFLFDGSKQRQKVGALSGGERARVALAKALRTGANLLLLDEPTNDLDVAMLGELEDLLCAWPGCALVVSHDRAFLNLVATSILAFEGSGVLTRYAGNFATYREQRAAAQARAQPPASQGAAPRRLAPQQAPKAAEAAPLRRPLTYAERLELAAIVDRIADAEAVLAQHEAALSDAATYSQGPAARKRAQDAYESARAAVAQLNARWEELETRKSS
jgi:ATP-binding cassette subfamily F protein uup